MFLLRLWKILTVFAKLCFCSLHRDDNGIVFKNLQFETSNICIFRILKRYCHVNEQPKCIKSLKVWNPQDTVLLWTTVSIDIIQGSAIDVLTGMERTEWEIEVGLPCVQWIVLLFNIIPIVQLTKHLSEQLINTVCVTSHEKYVM